MKIGYLLGIISEFLVCRAFDEGEIDTGSIYMIYMLIVDRKKKENLTREIDG
jgi:hypothetical protein